MVMVKLEEKIERKLKRLEETYSFNLERLDECHASEEKFYERRLNELRYEMNAYKDVLDMIYEDHKIQELKGVGKE